MSDDFDHVMGMDRLNVVIDGEQIEVFNHASVVQTHYVNSVNGYETGQAELSAGDDPHGPEPDAVTKRLARLLYDEFDIECEPRGIRVVDVTDESVEVI